MRPPSGLIEGHAGRISIQQLFIRIGESAVLLQVSFLPLLHLELFGMNIGHIGSRGGGCGTGKDLFSVVIDPETQADQDPAVIFTFGHSDILVGTLLNIFAVERQNPSAPGTNRMNCRFALQRVPHSVENLAGGLFPGSFPGMDQLAGLLGIVQHSGGIRQGFEDQGGICCYCGMKLDYPFDPQYRVEHVIPKEIHRELVGEYKNLLLSCRATKEETDARNAAPKKTRRDFMHCDEKKGSSEIAYSPLDPACETVFIYKQDGSVSGANQNATNDIGTLGLDCDYLVRRRKEALEVLFDGDELLSDDLLREFKEKVMTRDANNRLAEFCFVISNVIRQILS